MTGLDFKKFLVTILTAILLFQPVAVFAQIGEVPISHPGLGTGGIAGSIAATASKAALATATASNEVCQKAEVAFNTANTIKGIAYGGLSLIGGNQAEVADLEVYKKAVDGFIKCREAVKTTLLAAVTVNLYDGQTKQRLNDDISIALRNLEKRRDDIETQAKIAKRGLWKGIFAGILIKTTKVVSQRLVNSLTSRYKINDIMQYADAVASNVYTAQLIHDRAADNEEQMIFRSIISNPLLRTKLNNVIYQRAADALELNGQVFSARGMSADDPDFYLKMAKFGNAETSVPFLKTTYENRAAEIQSAGVSSAQNEMLLGSGLKAPRTCAGNVNEQKSIELRWGQANDKLANRQALYNDLYEAYNTKFAGLSPKERKRLFTDLDKAEADYLKAAAELKAMPTTFKSVDNKSTGQKKSLLFKTCETIASPAESVNKGIDAAFKSFSKGLADYNDNNLPFFMSWVSDIGSSIASNLIFGGDLKATLLAESGNVSQAINTALSFADANAAKKNLENGISFGYDRGNTADEQILSWEVLDVKNASFVTIIGNGITDIQRDSRGQVITDPKTKLPVLNRLPLSGSTAIRTKTGGNYILKVYDSAGKLLTNQASINIVMPTSSPPNPSSGGGEQNSVCGGNYASYGACVNEVNDEAYCRSICGTVSGAFIKKPSESLRGQRTEGLR